MSAIYRINQIMSQVKGFRDLIVYQKAYKLAMQIFEISKNFPKEEKYSLTDQIRRSSRSVTSNIAEAWARKKYIKSFKDTIDNEDNSASNLPLSSVNHHYNKRVKLSIKKVNVI